MARERRFPRHPIKRPVPVPTVVGLERHTIQGLAPIAEWTPWVTHVAVGYEWLAHYSDGTTRRVDEDTALAAAKELEEARRG